MESIQTEIYNSGYVKDAKTGEYLIGANVYLKEVLKGTATNQYGFYSLTFEEGEYTLVFTFLGFKEKSQKIKLDKDFRINSELEDAAFQTQEVVITGEKETKCVSPQMGKVDMDVEKLKTLPALWVRLTFLNLYNFCRCSISR
jgi:hypothetical protein